MTPPPTEPNLSDSAHARERLCFALAEIVSDRGYAAATVGGVSERAGLDPEAFWAEFGSIEDCYLALYAIVIDRLHRQVDAAIDPCGATNRPWQDQLEAGFASLLGFFANEPVLARAVMVEVLAAGPTALRWRDEALQGFIGYVESVRIGAGGSVPEIVPEMIVRGTADLIYSRVARDEAASLPSLLPELHRSWLMPLIGSGAAS